MYLLELTEEELEFVYTRCLRKAMRLEESHLEDVPCYDLANKIMWKINDLKREKPLHFLEVSQATYNDLQNRGLLNPNLFYFIKDKEA